MIHFGCVPAPPDQRRPNGFTCAHKDNVEWVSFLGAGLIDGAAGLFPESCLKGGDVLDIFKFGIKRVEVDVLKVGVEPRDLRGKIEVQQQVVAQQVDVDVLEPLVEVGKDIAAYRGARLHGVRKLHLLKEDIHFPLGLFGACVA